MNEPPHPGPHEPGGVPVISDTREIFDGSVARLIHHLEDRGPTLRGAGQKPGAHGVSRILCWVESYPLGINGDQPLSVEASQSV